MMETALVFSILLLSTTILAHVQPDEATVESEADEDGDGGFSSHEKF
jgi:hypothetical protein